MGSKATGVDVGTATAKLIAGEVKGTSFLVSRFVLEENAGGDVEQGWSSLRAAGRTGTCRVGLTGRDVNVRYTRVPRLPDWQLRKLMRFEAQEVGGQSESQVASDFNVLPEIPEIEGEDVVLLAMARESLLDRHAAGLAGSGGGLDAYTPNAIALYNAFLHYGVVMEDTVLVANIGRDNVDVIVVRGTDLLFARNLTGGAKLFDEAIAQRFGIDAQRAERFKIDHGTLNTNATFRDPNAEKACRAMQAPAGQILSLLQSTLLFCKNQIKLSSLRLDRVLLCGGGAALDGLPSYLSKGMGVTVEIFDPFVVVDTTRLDPEAAQLLDDHRLEAVVALGLATTASDSNAYSIEILPEKVRRRRAFLAGPAWLLAAALVAVGYLGFSSWKASTELSELRAEAASLGSRARRAKRNDAETRTVLEQNADLDRYARRLFHLAGSGEQLVRTIAVVEEHVPRGFWVDSLTSGDGWDDELGVPRGEERPIVRLEGRAREGTDSPALAFQELVAGLESELPGVRLKQRMGDAGSIFSLELTTLASPEEPPADESPGATDGEEG